MKKVTPIFVFNSLDSVRGGLTKAVLTRANTLIKHFEEVHFFTLQFQKNHNEVINKLYNSGKLNPKVKVHNFFIDMDTHKNEHPIVNSPDLFKVKEPQFVEFKDEKSDEPAYRYYNNGVYVKYKKFNHDGNLLFIDYMNESRHRTKREEYNENGTLVRTRHMDLITNSPSLDRYFSKSGKCFLTTWLDPNTGKVGRSHIFDPDPLEFKNLNELFTYWITNKIATYNNPILMSDSRATDEVLINIKSDVKKIAVLHNNHFKAPYTKGSSIKATWKPLFDNLDKFDKIIFLTHEQKNDVIELFGDKGNFEVIPHSANQVEQTKSRGSYDQNLAVTLARYESQKKLDEAIKAFKYVVKEIPNAKYYIYGFGKEKNNLQKIINELNLEKNVFLKGFTDDPVQTYRSAACSILTSDYEGFGLVLTESLASGTPVVSYDIKYGPKDIIRDGVDGFLIPKGNQEQLAQKIIEIMKNRKLREEFSKNAVNVVDRFSFSFYEKQWISVISEFSHNKFSLFLKKNK
ncbi:glycosyltransferase [Heyndrickxia sporothermodurans]|uniref:Glycosyltransferase n=1 Tax=Heyndrickxia sporothermodurans TaxID=46224 RepID=A0AB37H9K7_9BACI|nr:glycosyltransferase [Heyndrickxia sporothermodurans]MBL5783506.1 glycosyltransferase [Heyndrickxia sporothermodurans]MBL5793838.1 glycosyltransferase [Heyndrickxia sporothermodurans]MBL5805121.1 glycosyltransferase [Heyndrickxia sporothermodurans]MBL5854881.1 glycosyltransferase [Heyndrickxia sporothermodurans]MBL5867836.1 glycosyltransferase [Heyndrickxia sporothermodurans]